MIETPTQTSLPVTVDITPSLIDRFRQAGISTTWNIDEFDAGRGWLSDLKTYTFKSGFTIEGPCAFYGGIYGPNVWTADGGLCAMGASSYSHSPLPGGVTVGRYCSIGKGLRFLDFSHPIEWLSSSVSFFKPSGVRSTSALASLADRLSISHDSGFARREFDPKLARPYPRIGHDVWIGENVALSMGISIGTGSVIAAGSIVTRDIPPYAIVAGVPASVRRLRFPEALVKTLLATEWWQYCFADFEGLDFTQPETFVTGLNDKIKSGDISQWNPLALNLPRDLLA